MTEQTLSKYGAAILRISLGVMFIAHGLLKFLVFTPAGTVGFFESLGLPAALAWAVMLAETIGGVLLISGAYTRLVAIALLPVLLGAMNVHFANGWVFSAPNGGWEYPAFLAAATLAQIGVGAGALSISAPNLPFLPAIFSR